MENSANVARIQDLFAFQKGFVEDITDPKGSGRIKVRIIGKEYRQEDDKTIPEPCLLYTSPSPRDGLLSRMPSSA